MTEEHDTNPPAEAEPPAILQPGRNCWRIAPASRAALLPDAATYFARLAQAFQQARHSILIIGWDFDGRIRLCPTEETCQPLGAMLRQLVEAKPELEIHILVWSFAVVHAPSAPSELLLNQAWEQHPRIHLKLDREHPVYAAHHQKIVCIDDQLAFVGGIDLTVKRWDTWRHKARDRRRIDPEGDLYEPVHDMQMAVEGKAAEAVAAVARSRWQRARGEEPPPVPATERGELWPPGLEPQFIDTEVAVARTLPAWRTFPPVHEISALTLDAIAAARSCIYIEAQYFANFEVAELLEQSLRQPTGPEVVVLMSRRLPGTLEQFIMGRNRDRVLRRLMRADRHGRFGGYYTCSPSPGGDIDILIHAKLMIIDDRFLKVGSANINNRSVGLDTECDLAIEAQGDADRQSIATIRRQLLAGHLRVTPEELRAATVEHGSTIRAIRALQAQGKGLRDFAGVSPNGRIGPVIGTALLDPKEPIGERWRRLGRRRSGRATLAPS
ncbi:MAG TPA: phospholipase D-like domain-containing protein [Geminicoccus sp.]|uniref:phospholipase D-like domain-containing protein n=1 Tax=Geminicoccus sp. TaxID=2024832 RepID=UPI002C4C7D7B|nr:phospholipase D-like domain-containing protein [Geminicoccus sp.]HWL66903.1 phospholipase D-like domain-containing protein [Geminicoccus sp.]